MRSQSVIAVLLVLALSTWAGDKPGSLGAARKLREVEAAISELESALHAVCTKADAGKLSGTVRVVAGGRASSLDGEMLTFSAATFDQDLDKALDVLDRYEKARASLRPLVASSAGNGGEVGRPLTAEERLRAAEESLPEARTIRTAPGSGFSVFQDYEKDHKRRQAVRNRMAEEDMANVAEERRLAAAEASVRGKAALKLQEQNRRWQEELDAQATREAMEAEAWQREHSAGAFFRKLTRNIVGGAVTSFTGGFAESMGAGAADYVIRKKFPDFRPTGKYDRDDD